MPEFYKCFPVSFKKYLRTPFSCNTSGGCLYLLYIFGLYKLYNSQGKRSDSFEERYDITFDSKSNFNHHTIRSNKKSETPKGVPSTLSPCEFSEVFENSFVIKHLQWVLLDN